MINCKINILNKFHKHEDYKKIGENMMLNIYTWIPLIGVVFVFLIAKMSDDEMIDKVPLENMFPLFIIFFLLNINFFIILKFNILTFILVTVFIILFIGILRYIFKESNIWEFYYKNSYCVKKDCQDCKTNPDFQPSSNYILNNLYYYILVFFIINIIISITIFIIKKYKIKLILSIVIFLLTLIFFILFIYKFITTLISIKKPKKIHDEYGYNTLM